MYERNLDVTLQLSDDGTEFEISIREHQSGDHVSLNVPFVGGNPHPEFDRWIGEEIYGWLFVMAEDQDNDEIETEEED